MTKENMANLIPSAVALAMGVVGIILMILKQSQETVLILLAIAVLCLGFMGLNNASKDIK